MLIQHLIDIPWLLCAHVYINIGGQSGKLSLIELTAQKRKGGENCIDPLIFLPFLHAHTYTHIRSKGKKVVEREGKGYKEERGNKEEGRK